MKPVWRRILGPGLSVILFAAALWLLHNEVSNYHLGDILHAFDAIPGTYLWAAAGLTILSYAVMTGYDVLAIRYIRNPLAYAKIGLASFTGYAFSNNIGLSMIAGASVRYLTIGLLITGIAASLVKGKRVIDDSKRESQT